MAFDSSQLALIAEITLESYVDVETAAGEIEQSAEDRIVEYLDTWEGDRLGLSHVKLKGGKDGLDFDNERKRAYIRMTIRQLLGFSLFSEFDPSNESLHLFQLEVGSNFG